ncbi:Uncharacterised protein [Streptomyces griseus]|nr:Uncharacterised protein [Streptomyces griseus]
MGGEPGGGGVVEDERGGQAQTGEAVEAVAQFDGGQRVEAEVPEGAALVDGGGVVVAEHERGVAAYQVGEFAAPVVLGQCGEPADQFGRLLLVLRHGGRGRLGERPSGLGDLVEEVTGPLGGEDHREAVPPHVDDDGAGLVVVEDLLQRPGGGFGVEREHAVATRPVADRALGHACAGPGPPGDGGGREPGGTSLFGEGFEVDVARCVVAEAGGAERGGEGGEEDEGGEVAVPGELVEVVRATRLDPQHPLDPVGVEGVHHTVVEDGGGVEHGGERQFSGDAGELGLQGVAVGDVAGGDRGPGTRLRELGDEFGRAGRVRSAPAEQQEVRGPVPGEPARDVRTEGAGASGDQDGALGPPGARRDGAPEGSPQHAAGEEPGGPERQLVLPVAAGQGGGEEAQRGGVGLFRQVHEPAPQLRLLQGDDTAESPQLGLRGIERRLVGAGSDGASGGAPERRAELAVGGGLDQGEGGGVAGGDGGLPGVRPPVERQQREDAADLAVARRGAQGGGEHVPVGCGGVGGEEGDPGPRVTQGALGGLVPYLRSGGVGRDDDPVPRRPSRARVGRRVPGDPVAPGVGLGLFAAAVPPAGQGGQQIAQAVTVEVERGGQRGQILALDGVPEVVLGRVTRGCGGGRAVGQPVGPPLEGVRGQVGDGALADQRGPVDGQAVGEGLCQ